MENSQDPSVWWDRQPIKSYGGRNKFMRVNKEQSALIINLNETELLVIEVKYNGKAGRELIIKNETGSRISCHEALNNNKILTVNQRGLMRIYEVDYGGFSKHSLIKSSQITPKRKRGENQFGLAICERSKICAVQVDCDSRASRIIIYGLKDEKGQDSFSLLTKLDVYRADLKSLGNGCFSPYIGDNLILCVHDYSNQRVYAFGYDMKINKLSQMFSKSIKVGKYCFKLSRVGSEVCGIISDGGKILRFKFNVVVSVKVNI